METTTRVELYCDTLAQVGERLVACATLGLRDVTVTSLPIPRTDTRAGSWKYVLDARMSDPSDEARLKVVSS